MVKTIKERADELILELDAFGFTIGEKAKGLRGNDAQVLEDLSVDVLDAASSLRDRFEQLDDDVEVDE